MSIPFICKQICKGLENIRELYELQCFEFLKPIVSGMTQIGSQLSENI